MVRIFINLLVLVSCVLWGPIGTSAAPLARDLQWSEVSEVDEALPSNSSVSEEGNGDSPQGSEDKPVATPEASEERLAVVDSEEVPIATPTETVHEDDSSSDASASDRPDDTLEAAADPATEGIATTSDGPDDTLEAAAEPGTATGPSTGPREELIIAITTDLTSANAERLIELTKLFTENFGSAIGVDQSKFKVKQLRLPNQLVVEALDGLSVSDLIYETVRQVNSTRAPIRRTKFWSANCKRTSLEHTCFVMDNGFEYDFDNNEGHDFNTLESEEISEQVSKVTDSSALQNPFSPLGVEGPKAPSLRQPEPWNVHSLTFVGTMDLSEERTQTSVQFADEFKETVAKLLETEASRLKVTEIRLPNRLVVEVLDVDHPMDQTAGENSAEHLVHSLEALINDSSSEFFSDIICKQGMPQAHHASQRCYLVLHLRG